jgi:cytochrome c oxidase subunit 4
MSGKVIPRRTYFVIAALLLVLLAATAWVAEIDLGRFNIVVALTIAVLKALLVILYFMEVRYSSRLSWIVAGAGFFWLLILIALTMSDVLTRVPVTLPPH